MARDTRRRRGGQEPPDELQDRPEQNAGYDAAVSTQSGPKSPTQVHAQKATPKAGAKDGDKLGLLHRIGRGLKSLISRSPRSQH